MPTVSLAAPAAIEKAIRRALKVSPKGASDDVVADWVAPNGRWFEVRGYDDGTWLLSELRPNGRMARQAEGQRIPDVWDEPRLPDYAADPNGFRAKVPDLGIDEHAVVRSGGGIGVATIFHPSLAVVARAIRDAIAANRPYDDVDRRKLADPAFRAELRRSEAKARAEHRRDMRTLHERATAEESGLFKGLHAAMGPLTPERKRAILSYLNAPDEARWDAIHGTCIKGFKTLWQAWIEVDPAAPKSKPADAPWPAIPSPDVLRRALREAADAVPPEPEAIPGRSPR